MPILDSLSGFTGMLKGKATGVLNSLFPPEKRAEVLAKLQNFALNNPKLAAFLLTNFALTGFPVLMFFVFTLTVFVFSLVAAILLGVLVALLFTVFMVGVALLVILPTVFITTMGASFLFLWGLGGYYLLKWFNDGETPAVPGEAIGDKLNSLTGGRMGFLMDRARTDEAKGASKKENGQAPAGGKSDSNKAHTANGSAQNNSGGSTPSKISKDSAGKAADTDGATKHVDGAKKRTTGTASTASNSVGAAKGAAGVSTG